MKIYVASSWRNPHQPGVVAKLREAGHEVYDFRNPEPGDSGFSWKQIDPDSSWLKDPERFRTGLQHPIAQHGFGLDMGALRWCDACVMVLPCGRSAHLELGWATGAGKKTVVLFPDRESLVEPELMYLMNGLIALSVAEVLDFLKADATPTPYLFGLTLDQVEAVRGHCETLCAVGAIRGYAVDFTQETTIQRGHLKRRSRALRDSIHDGASRQTAHGKGARFALAVLGDEWALLDRDLTTGEAK